MVGSVKGTQLMAGASCQSFNPDLLCIGLASKCIASIVMLGQSIVSVIGSFVIGRLSLLHGPNNGSDMFDRNFTEIALGGTTLIQLLFMFFVNLITFLK